MRYKLQSETILTSLLREKIHSKELEVEQLQAELAAAVRGNDILRCEVQNAMDNLSCLTHKLKDVELLVTHHITCIFMFNVTACVLVRHIVHNVNESGALYMSEHDRL